MSLEVWKPPTDTLYKFLAILGLLFFLSSLLSPIWIHREFDAQESEYARDLQLLILNKQGWQDAQKEVERASAESDRAQKDLLEVGDRYDKKQASLQEMKRALDKAEEALKRQDTKLKDFRAKLLEFDKQVAEVNYKGSLYESAKSSTGNLLLLCVIGGVVGLVMTIIGFTLWYRRTQKYEDLVLRAKVEEPGKVDSLD